MRISSVGLAARAYQQRVRLSSACVAFCQQWRPLAVASSAHLLGDAEGLLIHLERVLQVDHPLEALRRERAKAELEREFLRAGVDGHPAAPHTTEHSARARVTSPRGRARSLASRERSLACRGALDAPVRFHRREFVDVDERPVSVVVHEPVRVQVVLHERRHAT